VSFSDPGIVAGIGANTFSALARNSEGVAACEATGANRSTETIKA
jgi:hypothetical protein